MRRADFYVDLAIEAPRAEPHQVDARAVRQLLDGLGLGVVCHAAPCLPVHNPSALVRRAALDELLRYLDLAADSGAPRLAQRQHIPGTQCRKSHGHL